MSETISENPTVSPNTFTLGATTYTVGDVLKPSKAIAKLLKEVEQCKQQASVALEGIYRTVLLDQDTVEDLVTGFFVDFQEPSQRKNYLTGTISRALFAELGGFLPIRLDFGDEIQLVVRELSPGERLDLNAEDVLKSLNMTVSSIPAKAVAKEIASGPLDLDFDISDRIGEVVFVGENGLADLLDFDSSDEDTTKDSELIQKLNSSVRQIYREDPQTPFCLVSMNQKSFYLTSIPAAQAHQVNVNGLYDSLIKAASGEDGPVTVLTTFTQPVPKENEDPEPMFTVVITRIPAEGNPTVTSISHNLETGEYSGFQMANKEEEVASV